MGRQENLLVGLFFHLDFNLKNNLSSFSSIHACILLFFKSCYRYFFNYALIFIAYNIPIALTHWSRELKIDQFLYINYLSQFLHEKLTFGRDITTNTTL